MQTRAEQQGGDIGNLLNEQTKLLSVLASNETLLNAIQQQIINYPNDLTTVQAEIEDAERPLARERLEQRVEVLGDVVVPRPLPEVRRLPYCS